ncbi:MAG: glycogen-debranching protein [Chlamydiales bacterium]|nr:glycogen-debranching protein [Chlamydiia bacterium]MCP5506823.1 glycogen-debranching protein [Chlamydiales bacterium]
MDHIETTSEMRTSKGVPEPYGTSVLGDGINFAVYTKLATHVTLSLYDYDSGNLLADFPLDPNVNKTSNVWHICIHGLPERVCYGYHIGKEKGKLYSAYFKKERLLLDPYARGVDTPHQWGVSREKYAPKGLVTTAAEFDWGEDRSPNIPLKDLVFYEMHVRGFTCDKSSGVAHPGTFLGVIEKIPFLKEMGVNAVKLMPIHEFNECEYNRFNPLTGKHLFNYWGYSTVQFFTPTNRYASCDAFNASSNEFRQMVKAFHEAGIEVILDVVFNHTAEGNEQGPIYSFKGLDCKTYYMMDRNNHMNFTGCGNTVNCNHPIVRDFIRTCLRYWVTEMHVDGFRFDLAGIFMRGENGEVLDNPPLIEELSVDPILADTKLIAEPWDAGGIYSLGRFYPKKDRWSEWNDQYRDCMRRFIKGDRGGKREFAIRICGSDVLFGSRSPTAGINFITAHDGFTQYDLVSYNSKHNSANAEDNNDGNPKTLSWNCGAEGWTDDPDVIKLREKQVRNFHVALMISQGVPMLLMGNEYCHTRGGNNNSWCQDNEMNWYLWDQLETNKDYFRFYKEMIHFRHRHEALRLGRFLTEEDIDWHSDEPFNPDWEGDTQMIAFTLKDPNGQYFLYVAFNAHQDELEVQLPPAREGSNWRMFVDTANEPPHDIFSEEEAPPIYHNRIQLRPHSCIILKS